MDTGENGSRRHQDRKGQGEVNWADALTKHLDSEKLMSHRKMVSNQDQAGRHELAPTMSKSGDLADQEGCDDENCE